MNKVWLNIYDPVNPPRRPETTKVGQCYLQTVNGIFTIAIYIKNLQLDIPTVMSSLFVSNACPMSIEIAATSKQEEKDTTNVIPMKNHAIYVSYELIIEENFHS